MYLNEIISRAELDLKDLIAVYCYGSRVYGTFNNESDYDFIIITTNKTQEQFSDNLININFFTPEEHQARLETHEISAIECQFVSSEFILLEKRKFKFKLDKSKLRYSLSAKSSNSWVKAKKKLTVEDSYNLNVGRKSLFHSFRIIDFGIQLANNGKIDFTSCNSLYKEIIKHYEWSDMFESFKQRYNEKCSEFKSIAHK